MIVINDTITSTYRAVTNKATIKSVIDYAIFLAKIMTMPAALVLISELM